MRNPFAGIIKARGFSEDTRGVDDPDAGIGAVFKCTGGNRL
jgi:hypothetical protein